MTLESASRFETEVAGAMIEARSTPVRAMSPGQVDGALTAYRELCAAVLLPDDWQQVKGKKFLKRQGWRKLALGFNVSLERVDHQMERDQRGRVLWASYTARATAPNGRTCTGEGYCDRFEESGDRKMRSHDIVATAETRAKNRAAADLFGLGAFSAEEVDTVDLPPPPTEEMDWRKRFRIRCRELGDDLAADADVLRHAIVRSATDGRTDSSRELSDDDRPAVLAVFKDVQEGYRVLDGDALRAAGSDDGIGGDPQVTDQSEGSPK